MTELRSIEERLRDLAFDHLRRAVEGEVDAVDDEKRLARARRAVEKAIHVLDGTPR